MEDVWIKQLATWLPQIVFVLLLCWHVMLARRPTGRSLIELYDLQVEENAADQRRA